MTKWLFHRKLAADFTPKSLRELLADNWLVPKYLIRQLRINKHVLVNQQYLPVNSLVGPNDQLDLQFDLNDFAHLPAAITVDPTNSVTPVYEDANLLIVNKRRGDKTHPNQPNELGSTLNFTANYLQVKGEQPFMVHRLDMETSGALIIAKNPVVVPILNRQISTKSIQRTYLTWVHGTDLPTSGRIDLPIGRDPDDKRKRKINGQSAQSAVTNYQVMKAEKEYSLLQVKLETGRTHQIRVHLAAIGHSLVGDPLYSQDYPSQPMLLHSWRIEFPLPFSDDWQEVEAPIPPDFMPLN